MIVRPRTEADLPACAALLLRVRAATGYPVRLPDDPVDWIRGPVLAWVADVAPDETAEVRGTPVAWVADTDGAILGHVALRPRSGRTAAVERLYVDPDRTRGGIGSILLRTATDRAATLGRRPVLETLDRPGGPLPFYAATGWTQTGREQVDWTEHELVHLTRGGPQAGRR